MKTIFLIVVGAVLGWYLRIWYVERRQFGRLHQPTGQTTGSGPENGKITGSGPEK
jgi:hypothetical protein